MVFQTLQGWAAPGVPVGVQDPDVWLRLLLVEHLHNGGGWYERHFTRLSAPEGVTNHWTRPLDLLLLVLAWPFTFFMPFKQALWSSAIVYNALLLLAGLAGTLWALKPLRLHAVAPWVVLGFWLTDPNILNAFLIGRADHHSLLLVLFVWVLGCGLRMEKYALLAGALAGLGLWVSPEFLAVIALVLVWLGVRWIETGERALLQQGLRFSLQALAVLLLAVMLEWPPAEWATVAHGRISIVHVTMLSLSAGVVLLALYLNPKQRLLFAGAAGAAGLVLLYCLYPGFHRGGLADIDPAMLAAFDAQMGEMRPSWNSAHPFASLAFYISPVIALLAFRRYFTLWTLVLAAFLVLASFQWRWGGYVAVVTCLGWVLLPARFPKLPKAGPHAPLLLACILLLGLRVMLLEVYSRDVTTPDKERAECVRALTKMVERDAMFSVVRAKDDVVLVNTNVAAQLLYHTPHRTLASNYHNNVEGLRDLDRFLFARGEKEAYVALTGRGVGVVLLCLAEIEKPMLSPYPGASGPLFLTEVNAGRLPPWLERVPGNYPQGMLYLRVKGVPRLPSGVQAITR